MKKTVQMNRLMNKLLLSKSLSWFSTPNERELKSEIMHFFNSVKIYERNGEKCFSTRNCFLSDLNVKNKKDFVMDWECDTNEIYLDKKIVKSNLKRSLNIALDTIEASLEKQFPNQTFLIICSVQYGSLRNIMIKVLLYRKSFYDTVDLEAYNQPVLKEIFST